MNPKVKQVITTILFGTLTCLIIGVISYGFVILKMNDMRSIIILFGLYGSIFFGAIKYLKRREQIMAVIIMIMGVIVLRGRTSMFLYYLRDIYLLLPLFISVYLYTLFIAKYDNYPLFIRGLSLVVIFPILYFISLLILVIILGINMESALRSLFIEVRLSIMVSVGLAIGFDLYEKYRSKINSLLKIV